MELCTFKACAFCFRMRFSAGTFLKLQAIQPYRHFARSTRESAALAPLPLPSVGQSRAASRTWRSARSAPPCRRNTACAIVVWLGCNHMRGASDGSARATVARRCTPTAIPASRSRRHGPASTSAPRSSTRRVAVPLRAVRQNVERQRLLVQGCGCRRRFADVGRPRVATANLGYTNNVLEFHFIQHLSPLRERAFRRDLQSATPAARSVVWERRCRAGQI